MRCYFSFVELSTHWQHFMSQTLEGIVDKDDPELDAFSDISWVVEQKKDQDKARALELKRAGYKPTKREIDKQHLGTRM